MSPLASARRAAVRRGARCAASAVLLASALACTDTTGNPKGPPTPEIVMSASALDVVQGERPDFDVRILSGTPVAPSIKWESSDPSVADVADCTGTTCIVRTRQPGTAVITVTVDVGGGIAKSSLTVTVRPPPPGVTGVTVTPAQTTVEVGQTTRIAAQIARIGSPDTSLVWVSSDTRVATVDANGVVTAVGPGEAVIGVRSVQNPNVQASTRVTVIERPVISLVDVFAEGTSQPVDRGNVSGGVRFVLGYTGGLSTPGTPSIVGAAGGAGAAAACSAWQDKRSTCDLNTAAVPSTPTGGVLVGTYHNGPNTFTATATGATSSAPMTLTLRNRSRLDLRMAFEPKPVWYGSDIGVTLVPTLFGDVDAPYTVPTIARTSLGVASASPGGPPVDLGAGAGADALAGPPFGYTITRARNGAVEGTLRVGSTYDVYDGAGKSLKSLFTPLAPISVNVDYAGPRISLTEQPARMRAVTVQAVKLEWPLGGVFKIGDVVPISRLPGGHVAGADVCHGSHYHGAVQIDGKGPFYQDPNAGACGWGLVVNTLPYLDLKLAGSITERVLRSATSTLYRAVDACDDAPGGNDVLVETGTGPGQSPTPIIPLFGDPVQTVRTFEAVFRLYAPVLSGTALYCLVVDAADDAVDIAGQLSPNRSRTTVPFFIQ
jgi:hypothetical protein